MSSLVTAASATFSDDKVYRYMLYRKLGFGGPGVVWVMLNPSTADGQSDDPTMRRVCSFSWAAGYRVIYVVNLFGLISPAPQALWKHKDPVGPQNDMYIQQAVNLADAVVCGWGANGTEARVKVVMPLLRNPLCLGVTKAGHPRHPLFVPASQALEPFIY